MTAKRFLYQAQTAVLSAAWLAACMLCLFVSACSSNIEVSPLQSLPTPLVEPIALRLGVYYSPEFRNFIYNESEDKQGAEKTTIAFGAAQISLYQHMLPALFTEVTELQEFDREQIPANLDAILLPQVADFEYSVPRTSMAKVYEVWIKYQFDLVAQDGSDIASWSMPVYGKTPTAMLTSNTEAIKQASLMALRDSGAAFITDFTRVPEIANWLEQRQATVTTTPAQVSLANE